MLDKVKFMTMMEEIVQIGKNRKHCLTKDEIQAYFAELELEITHYKHIYTYLAENHIKIKDFEAKSEEEVFLDEVWDEYLESDSDMERYEGEYKKRYKQRKGKNKLSKNAQAQKKEDSIYLKMYLEDISYFEPLTKEEEIEAFVLWMSGKEEAKEKLMRQYLTDVILIAKEYGNQEMSLEDLIQEGNIGLLKGLNRIQEKKEISICKELLLESIRNEIEIAMHMYANDKDWENTLLAKTNLISEAKKYLAEKLSQTPSLKELSEYTKIEENEIKEILNLSSYVV